MFQLEEFISHTIKSYEWELRQQRQQVEALTRENERLVQQRPVTTNSNASASPVITHTIMSASPGRLEVDANGRIAVTSAYSPAAVEQPVFDIKSEEIAPFTRTPPLTASQSHPSLHLHPLAAAANAGGGMNTMMEQWREYDDIDHLYMKVEETKRILSKILVPPMNPDISQTAFGWKIRFWFEGTRYYATGRKFFPGVRGFDIAQRMHRIEPAKYIETFPEVHAKKVLKVFNEHLKVVETVKALPGKPNLGSVTVQFVSHDDNYPGNRCFFANRSVALPESTSFGHHDECNGYAFDDITKTASDGSVVEGCLVQGVGGYDSMGKRPELLMEELAKVFSSVVLRWESLFVNDYITEEDSNLADIELDFGS